jgi:hypothetical protein
LKLLGLKHRIGAGELDIVFKPHCQTLLHIG